MSRPLGRPRLKVWVFHTNHFPIQWVKQLAGSSGFAQDDVARTRGRVSEKVVIWRCRFNGYANESTDSWVWILRMPRSGHSSPDDRFGTHESGTPRSGGIGTVPQTATAFAAEIEMFATGRRDAAAMGVAGRN